MSRRLPTFVTCGGVTMTAGAIGTGNSDAALLRTYLVRLRSPLVPVALTGAFFDAARLPPSRRRLFCLHALLLTLPPGAYTAMVSGANGAAGVAIVEVYEVR